MGDSSRFCLNCGQMRRYHKDWGVGHSRCKTCGFPSLWAVKSPDGKHMPKSKLIEKRRSELEFMLIGPRVYL